MVLDLPLHRRPPPAWAQDPPRPRTVAAWTATLGLHASVLLVLLLPREPLTLPGLEPVDRNPDVILIEPVPELRPLLPEPVPVQRAEPRKAAPQLPAPPAPAPQPIALAKPDWAVPVAPVMPSPAGTGAATGAVGNSEAVAVDRVTPPPYPGIALRRGLEGTVELLVLVGDDGLPQRVEVVAGSGHRELDRAAREHVLREWRFHPALRDGRPVSALVRVPIRFRIDAS